VWWWVGLGYGKWIYVSMSASECGRQNLAIMQERISIVTARSSLHSPARSIDKKVPRVAKLFLAAGVTLKCLPRDTSARREIITKLLCLPLLKHRRPHKKSPHYRIDNFPVKIRPARAAADRGEFFQVKCRPEGEFSGWGNSIMGHRQSHNYSEPPDYVWCFSGCRRILNYLRHTVWW